MPLPGKPFISEVRVRKRVREMARDLAKFYRGKKLTVIGLMNGSLFFMTDLVRHLPPETKIECWKVSGYRGKNPAKRLIGPVGCEGDYRGRHVLLLDDILDTGRTLRNARQKLLRTGATDVRICVLLAKNIPRKYDITADIVGFNIENRFVIGYGLDYNNLYRTLPMIRVLD